MTHADAPLTVGQVAHYFHRARRSDLQELLETLAALGHVEGTDDGRYSRKHLRHRTFSNPFYRPSNRRSEPCAELDSVLIQSQLSGRGKGTT